MGERESGMRREELIGWLEEGARQLKTGTLLIDGERVAIPEEVKSRIKTKDKKGRSSLKLQLEWETKPPKEAQKKDKKISEAVPHNDQKPERKTGAGPAAMARDYDSHILVCAGSDCKKRGSKGVRKALRDELRAPGILDDARIDTVDCLGLCKHGPNVVVYDGAEPKGFWYLGLEEADVPEVVEQHLKGGAPRAHLLADRRPRKAKKIKKQASSQAHRWVE